MRRRFFGFMMAGLLIAGTALAKGKSEKVLPPYILTARTVAVMVDPSAGIDPEDPRANQVAQKDVETALLNWGRFQPQIGTEGADLIIVIRRGHGKLVDTTISDPRQNNRAGVINPTDNGISAGHNTASNRTLVALPTARDRSLRRASLRSRRWRLVAWMIRSRSSMARSRSRWIVLVGGNMWHGM